MPRLTVATSPHSSPDISWEHQLRDRRDSTGQCRGDRAHAGASGSGEAVPATVSPLSVTILIAPPNALLSMCTAVSTRSGSREPRLGVMILDRRGSSLSNSGATAPDLRIIDQELWDRAKARQPELTEPLARGATAPAHAPWGSPSSARGPQPQKIIGGSWTRADAI